MNPRRVRILPDDELREHYKQHPTQPDPKYQPPANTLYAHVKQDLIAALNHAIHHGELDIDDLSSNIRDAGEYADKILGRGGQPDAHTIGVHADWTHVSWLVLNGAGARVYTTPYDTGSPGIDSTSVRLPSDRYPEGFVAFHGREWWGWVHPRWRWSTGVDGPPSTPE